MRRAFTLVEVIIVMVLASLFLAIVYRPFADVRDRAAVRAAVDEITRAYSLARQMAIYRGAYAAVRIDSVNDAVVVRVGADTLLCRRLAALHGVQVHSNRDSMAYTPVGLGWGAANQSIIVRRGTKADTVVLSRLGRVRF